MSRRRQKVKKDGKRKGGGENIEGRKRSKNKCIGREITVLHVNENSYQIFLTITDIWLT